MIKQVSKKQAGINRTLTQVYADMAERKEHICEGCGIGRFLSHSHIIRRSDRKDLETDPRNIHYHCLEQGNGCHKLWEDGTPEEQSQMLDFFENVAYIKEVHPELYRKKYEGVLINGVEL